MHEDGKLCGTQKEEAYEKGVRGRGKKIEAERKGKRARL